MPRSSKSSYFGGRRRHRGELLLTLLLGLGILVAGNRLAREHLRARVDLSEDQLYTPSPVGRELLGGLEDVLSVKAFFTGESRVGTVQIAKRRLIDQLGEFQEAAGGRMQLVFADPNDSSAVRAEATALGIRPYPIGALQGTSQVTQDTWLGLLLRYRGRELALPFVLPQGFEYLFLTALEKLTREEDVTLGFVTGANDGAEDLFAGARQLLAGSYRLREVLDLASEGGAVPPEVSVLVVARPTGLHARAAFQIDQFVQRGGRLLLLCERNLVSLRESRLAEVESGLEPLLASWGVEVSRDLIWDQARCNRLVTTQRVGVAGGVDHAQQVRTPYPFWPSLGVEGLDRANPVTSRLSGADLFWAHALSPRELAPGLAAQPLASTSESSWLVPAVEAMNLDPDALRARSFGNEARGGGEPRTVLLSLSGSFPSAFPERAPAPRDPITEALHADRVRRAAEEGREPPVREPAYTDEPVSRAGMPTEVVVMGDADWISDVPNRTTDQNRALFLNLIDWLALEDDLLALRSRQPRERRLADLLALERKALGLEATALDLDDPNQRHLAELEGQAAERAAFRRRAHMLVTAALALLAGGLAWGGAWLLGRRGRVA